MKCLCVTILSTTLALYAGSALADNNMGEFNVTANMGVVSQYSFRGISQSDEGPAIQGGVDVAHDSGLYAGMWGSSVDFNDGDEASVETDLYAGYSGAHDKINYDIGAIYYAYPGADDNLDYDFWELSLALGYDFDFFAVSTSLNYSPDYFAGSGDSFYYTLNTEVPLPYDLSLSGHVGYQAIDDNAAFGVEDYFDWSAGLNYNLKGFDLLLQYVDTDADEPEDCADNCGQKVILGVSRTF